MSQLVKTKRQANLKILSDLEPLRGLSNKKNPTRSCVNWALFGTRGSLKRSFHVLNWPTHAKKSLTYTNLLNKLLLQKQLIKPQKILHILHKVVVLLALLDYKLTVDTIPLRFISLTKL
jgi:hypothetical protein